LSAKYESSGNIATIARNAGDIGGASYGKYQFATNTGSANSFARWYGGALSGKVAGTSGFDAAWKAEARNNPKKFEQAQHQYIANKFYTPALKNIKSKTGVDFSSYPLAVQNVIWSVAVQHGVGGAARLFKNAGVHKGDSARQIIAKVYNERMNVGKYFSSSSGSIQRSVQNRFARERQDALNML
jgi:hypothetical protein